MRRFTYFLFTTFETICSKTPERPSVPEYLYDDIKFGIRAVLAMV